MHQNCNVIPDRPSPDSHPDANLRYSAGLPVGGAKFWDKIAKKYAKQPIADEATYRKKLQITQEYFKSKMEVLEFGCGTGSTAIIHAPYVHSYRAIDVSGNMIAIAKRKAEEQEVNNITFEQLMIEELKVEDNTYDVVLGMSILHLLEDKEKVISKVHKMLKPGGVFVTSTACLGDATSWFKLIAPIGKALGFFPLVKVFTTQEFRESLTNNGLEIEYQWQPSKDKATFIVANKSDKEE